MITNRILAILVVTVSLLAGALALRASCPASTGYLELSTPPVEDSEEWREFIATWDSYPIRVRLDGPLWHHLKSYTELTVKAWNSSIGCEVLTMSRDDGAELVISTSTRPDGESWAGSARYVRRVYKGKKYWGADILIYDLPEDDTEILNLLGHELGHALGLADLKETADVEKLMYFTVNSGILVSGKVLEEMQALYCSRAQHER